MKILVRMIDEFEGVNPHQDDDITEQERTKDESHETKKVQTYDHTKYRDQWMYIPDLLHQLDAGDIVDVARDDEAVDQ